MKTKKYLYPKNVRIFQLKDLKVPPKNFTTFLFQIVENFREMVLKENKCRNFDDVYKKQFREVKKYNPNISKKEVIECIDAPISLEFFGGVRYIKEKRPSMKIGKMCPSPEIEYPIFDPYLGKGYIPYNKHKSEIRNAVSFVNKKFDKLFKKRSGKIPSHLFRSAKNEKIPWDFRFGLSLKSFPTSILETSVMVHNYGSLSSSAGNYMIPAIRVTSKNLFGSMTLSKRFLEGFSLIVNKNYKVSSIEYRTSYVDDLILSGKSPERR